MNFPIGQVLQDVALPPKQVAQLGSQDRHCDPLRYVPGGQEATHVLFAATLYVPLRHVSHPVGPPPEQVSHDASHRRHDPFERYQPTGQEVQSFELLPPLHVSQSGEQSRHVDES